MSKYYTVYRNKDDSIIACGTSRECCKQMGLSCVNTFYSIVSKTVHGNRRSYTVVIDEDELLEDTISS